MVILYFCPIVQSTQHSPRFLCNLCYIILKVFALYTSTRHHLDQILCKKTQKNAINLTKHFRKELPNKNGTVFYPKISKKAKNNNILLKKPELPALCILQTKMLIFWFQVFCGSLLWVSSSISSFALYFIVLCESKALLLLPFEL